MSPNNGTLLNEVSRPKLLIILLGLSFIHLDFLLPHTVYFNDKNGLLSLVFKTL